MPSSGWSSEIGALLAKEARSELRGKTGLFTAGLFSVGAVVAIAFSSFQATPTPAAGAGLFWVALLFAASLSLPRTFALEEEQRTGDLLRMWARPHAVFWGKALFNLAHLLMTATILSVLFLMLAGLTVERFGLFAAGVVASAAALSSTLTLCGALVSRAANRSVLAAAIALPLLLPLLALGVAAFKSALGSGTLESGLEAAGGLALYAAAMYALGPHLFAAVWRT